MIKNCDITHPYFTVCASIFSRKIFSGTLALLKANQNYFMFDIKVKDWPVTGILPFE